MAINLSIPSWKTGLEYIRSFPYVSSTFTTVHADEIARDITFIANQIIGFRDRDEAAEARPVSLLGPRLNLSTEGIIKSSGRAIVTYLALRTLGCLSLYINGTVGLGKMALGLTIGLTHEPTTAKYKDAQALLESGAFQLAAGVADFCIGRYALISAGVALAHGAAPEYTQNIVDGAFIWKGDIELSDDTTEAVLAEHRANYSWLQVAADKVQRFILPDVGVSRLQAFINPHSIETT